jgi:hypothetical protein
MTDGNAVSSSGHFAKGNRQVIEDYYIPKAVTDETSAFAFKVFVRLNALKVNFKNVSFQHSILDGCYLRGCVFDSCDFTGCRFIGSNLHQSNFTGSKFEYATFERCQIDDDILEHEGPREENLRMRFARSLRVNYQQIGDAKAVNKAITLELKATADHLLESWRSDKPYHREKYPGLQRVAQFWHWVVFWLLEFVWGNGESVLKLLRTIVIAIFVVAIYDASSLSVQATVADYWDSLKLAPHIFVGTVARDHHSVIAASSIVSAKLLALSLLTALLVKRFGRR